MKKRRHNKKTKTKYKTKSMKLFSTVIIQIIQRYRNLRLGLQLRTHHS
jgi:hypothetical protein